MEVFQVIMTTDVFNTINRDEDYMRQSDEGLFKTLEDADQYIENKSKQQLEAAIQDGDGVSIVAYPREEINDYTYTNVMFYRKSIMIYFRETGEFCRLSYYVQIRSVE